MNRSKKLRYRRLRSRIEQLERRYMLDGTLVFNELMYNPVSTGETLEWLEIHNQMAVDVDLSGWQISGGIDFQFAAGTVAAAGDYVVIAKSPTDLEDSGGPAGSLGPFDGSLSNSGETLRLSNSNGRLIDVVDYRDEGDWPTGPDGSGASLAKHSPTAASTSFANWTTSIELGGTPGSENFPVEIQLANPAVIFEFDSNWRYEDSNIAPPADWMQTGFDDSSWTVGAGLLHNETDPLPAVKSTAVNANAFTVYARQTFTVSEPVEELQFSLEHIVDDGAVIFVNGTEVRRVNLAAGTVDHATEANARVDNAAIQEFTVPANAIVQGSNTIAIEVHQFGEADSWQLVNVGDHLGPGMAPDNLARTGTAFAQDLIFGGGHASHEIAHLNDGWYGNPNSWIGNNNAGLSSFAGVALSAPASIDRIAFGRSNVSTGDPCGGGVCTDRSLGNYTIQYTTVAAPNATTPNGNWVAISNLTYDGATPTPHLRHLYEFPAVDNVTGIRIVVSNGQIGIDELEIYGQDDADIALGAKLTRFEIVNNEAPEIQLSEVAAGNDAGFFIELHNFGDDNVSTAGIELRTSSGHEVALVVVDVLPESYRVLDLNEIGYTPLSGERLHLVDTNSNLFIDSIDVQQSLRARDEDGRWQFPVQATPLVENVFDFTADIVINEIMFHPKPITPLPGETFVESGNEWLELYNRGTEAIDLVGWELQDAVRFTFPPNTMLGVDEYIVVAADPVVSDALYPGLQSLGPYAGSLSDRTDRIQLFDANGNVADEVEYFDSGRWSTSADGGGASLELRDPHADNSTPEAWADSQEGGTWQSYSYRGTMASDGSSTRYNEFVLGMLDSGSVLVDDIVVIEDPDGTAIPILQNGNFELDALDGPAASWRIQGTHSGRVVLDPDDPANRVLHLEATGNAEDRFNHAETTFVANRAVTNGLDYEVSFRTKWLAGSNQLNSRFYFNRLPHTTLLDFAENTGTPGAVNSVAVPNAGPTFSQLQHDPAVPEQGETISVSVNAVDNDGVSNAQLWYSVNESAWQSVSMVAQADDEFVANISGQSAGDKIQFYVTAEDSLGVTTSFPSDGQNSRAVIPVRDGQATAGPLHNLRIVMTDSDRDLLHSPTSRLSNGSLGATVIYNESEVFHDVDIRLRGSNAGRSSDSHVSYRLQFDPTQLFRGVHRSVAIDRSGRGSSAQLSQDELLTKHIANQSGIVATMDDLVHVIAPNPTHTRTAALLLTRYGNDFLDSQFENGGNGNLFKMDIAYVPNNTIDGNPESPKVPVPYSHPAAKDLQDLGPDKEAYRIHLQLRNNRDRDDYEGLVELSQAFSLFGTAFDDKINELVDVDQWARTFALQSLTGSADAYTRSGLHHNIMFYERPNDGKMLALMWDWDFAFTLSTSSSLIGTQSSTARIFANPANARLFHGHLLDLINTTFNRQYLDSWIDHYSSVAGQNWANIKPYIDARRAFVLSQLPAQTSFAITTNGGQPLSTGNDSVVLQGSGWIDVRSIRRQDTGELFNVTWLDGNNWQIEVPVSQGETTFVLEALDHQGDIVGNDSIVVTSTADGGLFTDLRITELMYNPAEPSASEALVNADKDAYEFVELRNVGSQTLSLGNVQFSNGVTFDFAGGEITSLEPGEFVLVVANEAAFEARYGLDLPVAGEYTGQLRNSGESFAVSTNSGATIQDFAFSDSDPWPNRADGNGSSLEVVSTAGQYNDNDNWRNSTEYHGSPGFAGLGPFQDVVINEVLSSSTLPSVDFIELYNSADIDIDVSGWWISDSNNYRKFQIPADTMLATDSYLVFDEIHFNATAGASPNDFALNGPRGDDVWLLESDNEGNLIRFADHVEFSSSAPDETLGRWPNGFGEFARMASPTVGDPNSGPRIGPIVISEIMYHVPDLAGVEREELEFVEIHNSTLQTVSLANWKLSGAIEFTFPADFQLEGGDRIVVTTFDPESVDNQALLTEFETLYMVMDIDLLGGYVGRMDNDGERVQLLSPIAPPLDEPNFIPYVIEDEVRYDDVAPWPNSPDGLGPSLNRISATSYGNDPGNWWAASPSPGGISTPPTFVTWSINTSQVDPPDLPGREQPTSWQTQRSTLATLEFEFSTAMDVTNDDVVLTNLGVDAGVDPDESIEIAIENVSVDGAIVTIDLANIALPDGVYQIEFLPTATDLGGNGIDVDEDGLGGDEFVIVGNSQNRFYRLASDWNGDEGASVFDFSTFSYWFGLAVAADGAPSYVDLNNDAGVSVFDFTGFSNNFGVGVAYPVGFVERIESQHAEDPSHQELADPELIDRTVAELVLLDWNATRRFNEHSQSELASENEVDIAMALLDDTVNNWLN
jgi:hypothetical protein